MPNFIARPYLKKYNNYNLTEIFGICYASNTDGYFLFDKEDYEKIYPFCWFQSVSGYANHRYNNERIITMQQVILNMYENKYYEYTIDHINRIRYDNRKENLRLCSWGQNAYNKNKRETNTSGVIGVSETEDKTWHSYLSIKGQRIFNKIYKTFDEAVRARLLAEKEYFGEFAPQQHLFKQYGIK